MRGLRVGAGAGAVVAKKNRINSRRRRRLGAFLHFVQGGKCYLCGFDVVCPSRWPVGLVDGSMPTLDHVVPLAAGGTNAETNQALAHHWCNQRRADSDIGKRQIRIARKNANAILFVRSVRLLSSIVVRR